MKKKTLYNLSAAVLTGIVIFFTVYFGWLYPFNSLLQDSIYQRENKVSSTIKIIAVDEKTLDKLGQFENWTREPYAKLINTLNTDNTSPRVIGIDILFANSKGKEDALLVDACMSYKNVVLASNLVFDTKIVSKNGRLTADNLHIDSVELPFDAVRPYTKSGFANTVKDSRDGYIRYALLNQEEYSSFALQVAQTAYGKLSNNSGGMFIDYTASPNMYETFSMIDVLEGEIEPSVFKDSIVLVGATAAGMGDAYYTPIAKGGTMYGVEINANIVQGLLEERGLTYLPSMLNGIICGIFGMLIAFLIFEFKIRIGVLSVAFTAFANYALALVLDTKGTVINLVALPTVIFIVFIISVAIKYLIEKIHKHKVIGAFKKYVAPQVVENIAKNGDYKMSLGGTKKNIAVLFVDIRGFTPLSEQLLPEQVVAILNEYLDMVTKAVFKYGGTLDKFIGDAAMAVFNAPFDCEDYTYKAIMTAREIAINSSEIFERLSQQYGCNLGCGIGVNCGDAVVGNIGSDFRMDYTAIGDTVNTAARLESNAKTGQILISDAVYKELKDRINAVPLEDITLKGKKNKIEVYYLTD